jgi:hypothetical protein
MQQLDGLVASSSCVQQFCDPEPGLAIGQPIGQHDSQRGLRAPGLFDQQGLEYEQGRTGGQLPQRPQDLSRHVLAQDVFGQQSQPRLAADQHPVGVCWLLGDEQQFDELADEGWVLCEGVVAPAYAEVQLHQGTQQCAQLAAGFHLAGQGDRLALRVVGLHLDLAVACDLEVMVLLVKVVVEAEGGLREGEPPDLLEVLGQVPNLRREDVRLGNQPREVKADADLVPLEEEGAFAHCLQDEQVRGAHLAGLADLPRALLEEGLLSLQQILQLLH